MDCYIKTLVFFDLETSGLIDWRPGQRPLYPDIIEISMVAVHRDSLLSRDSGSGMPRVLHKLTLPVNTTRALNCHVTELTGLDNRHLEHAPQLVPAASTAVAAFLECLAPPVCLIAHNGDKFDFPIFLHHFHSVANMQSVISHIFCVDALPIFKELDASRVPKSWAWEMNGGCYRADACASFLQESNECTPPPHSRADWNQAGAHRGPIPSSGTCSSQRTSVARSGKPRAAQRLFASTGATQAEDQLFPQTQVTLAGSDAGDGIGAWPLSQDSAPFGAGVLSQCTGSPRLSYKLSNLHARLFGRPPQACHGAEVDAETLLKCARWYGHHFLELCDQRAAEMWLFAYLASDACI